MNFGEFFSESKMDFISLEKIYNSLMRIYKDTLRGTLRKMLEVTVNLKDDESKKLQCEAIMETFNLSKKQLNDYLLIIKIEKMYSALCGDLEVIVEMLTDDINLADEFRNEIKDIEKRLLAIHSLIKDVSVEEDSNCYEEGNSLLELSKNNNFILYLSNVDEERNNTISSKSGKGNVTMNSICKEISLLSQSNYEVLRQNSKIHQINEPQKHSGLVLTSNNVAFERIGGGSTKIGYIRIPVLQSNLEILKKKYNNVNLRYLMLIICFGDFFNDGIDEKKLYNRFRLFAEKYMNEIEIVIKIFKEPFTPETFELACNMIEQGIDITNSLKDNPMKSLNYNNKRAR